MSDILSRLVIVSYTLLLMVTESVQVVQFETRKTLWKPTESQPCRRGKYATVESNGIKCRHCSLCRRGQQKVKDCGTHSDTECEACPSGFFNDARGDTCKECGVCQPGTYIRHHCTSTRDTKCRPCPRHRFTQFRNSEFCERCDTCRTHEKISAKCRKDKDTVCGDCSLGYFREIVTGNCLPCSPCPLFDLRRYVVQECQTRLGVENPDVCWPGVFDQPDDKDHQELTTEEYVELNVENNDLREEGSLLLVSIALVLILSFAITISAMFMVFYCVIRMRRRYRGFPNMSDNGSFVYITPDQERHNTQINVLEPYTQTDLPSDNWIASETVYTTSFISVNSSPSSSDNQSNGDLEKSASDTVSKSAPNVIHEEEEVSKGVLFTLGPDIRKKKPKRKSKKRKNQSPSDVCYYNVPSNPKYFPQQLYVTL